jgi:hypothetical protein
VTVTRNEIITSLNKSDDFILAVAIGRRFYADLAVSELAFYH